MSTTLYARRFVVHGRVQGVGFRWFVREQARARGLAGVVENAADGSVIVAARGLDDRLRALERALHEGPSGSQVTRVEVGDLPPEAAEALPLPFTIRR